MNLDVGVVVSKMAIFGMIFYTRKKTNFIDVTMSDRIKL